MPCTDLGGFGRILWSQWTLQFLTFLEKRGSGEETENSRILVTTVGEWRGPLMSPQDMSLGLVWKCTALTRQAAGFRPGEAYRCTAPTHHRAQEISGLCVRRFFVGLTHVLCCRCRVVRSFQIFRCFFQGVSPSGDPSPLGSKGAGGWPWRLGDDCVTMCY